MSEAIGLVTGSEPFAGLPSNPAEILLRQVAGSVFGGITIKTVATPVDLDRLPDLLPELVATHRPAFVVSLGLGMGIPSIRVERMAINMASFAVADNVGNQPLGVPHTQGGPDGRAASWDAAAIVASLRQAGVPAVVSDHAGTHLCNYTLYAMLAALEALGRAHVPCGFFHLPFLPDQVVWQMNQRGSAPQKAPLAPIDLPSMSFELQVKGLRVMLTALAQQANARGD